MPSTAADIASAPRSNDGRARGGNASPNHMNGSHGIAGWQWLFLLEGIPTAIVGLIAFFYLDDKVADAKWLTGSQKAMLEANLREEQPAHALHSVKDGLMHPKVLLLSLIYFFFTMGPYGVSFWLPTLVKASGVADPLDIGLLSAIPYAAAAVSMLLVSQSSDARGERRWHLALPGVVRAAGLCASVAFAHSTPIAMIALTIGTMGVMTTISQFWVLPPSDAERRCGRRGTRAGELDRQRFRGRQSVCDRTDPDWHGIDG